MLAQRRLRLLGQILALCTTAAAAAAAAAAAQETYKLPAVDHVRHTIWVALLTLDSCLLQERYCAPFHPSHRTISLVC